MFVILNHMNQHNQMNHSGRRTDTDNMQPYPSYKPAHIDWIGEIPSHWIISKVKWELTFHNNRRIPIEADKRGDLQGDYPYYGASGIIDYVNNYIFEGTYILVGEDGANILSRSTPLAFIAEGQFWVNNHAHILKANNSQDKYYSLQIELNDFTTIASGSAQPKLTKEAIGDLQLVVPPLQEQQAIVSYLDEKTALIDELILKKERKIELLKEQRAALINQAVTKGLDATIPMKDSGIEWIGEVPEHWEVKKLTWITEFITCGLASTPEYVEQEVGVPFLSAQNVKPDRIVLNKFNYISKELHEKLTKIRKPQKGDLLVTRVGAGIGEAAIVDFDFDFSVYVSLTHIRTKNTLVNRFLMYFFSTEYAKKLSTDGTVEGGGQGNLNVKNVENYRISIPPFSEQKSIVAYLDEQTALIDKSIALESQKIEKLKEYRQSLISNVVTGKVKVV